MKIKQKMELMDNEKILSTYTKNLTLTTHRIRYEVNRGGKRTILGFMLEELDSCGIRYSNNPFLLLLAGISFLIGFFISILTNSLGVIAITLIIVGVFVIGYFLSRHVDLMLESGRSTIKVSLEGDSIGSALKFVHLMETAKNDRYLSLKNR
ncbi:hypothetical protein BEH94_02375 [Candidatus Altiarchaeales archaeon WOR_SM1_SCG]|nr:hypothetical protein BEH94_02375 [Candidatus Altiarchaeales archaeon WOR_SM1_SCG]